LGTTLAFYPTFHDFTFSASGASFHNGSNPDFQRKNTQFPQYPNGDDRGIVANTLGIDGLPVYIGGTTNTTYSAQSFDQWYNDGFILTGYVLYLTLNASNVYTYSSPYEAFFPLDNYGFGNQGDDANNVLHNFCFTMSFTGLFPYSEGQFLSVSSDDDTWVFVNNVLVIDQGGIHNPESTTIYLTDLEAELGLVVGQNFNFSVFYAERHTPGADFSFSTNIGATTTTTGESTTTTGESTTTTAVATTTTGESTTTTASATTTTAGTTTTTGGTGLGGFKQDPIFSGLQGETYQIMGADRAWFNILSAPNIQYNGYFHDTCSGKTTTVISEIAMDISGHKLAMNATGDLYLDGHALKLGHGWKGFPIEHGKVGNVARPWVNYVYLTTPDFAITIIRHPVDFGIQKPGMDFFGSNCLPAYFNSKVQLKNPSLHPHGLLGQTAHHVHPHQVHSGTQGEGEIEGSYKDYVVSNAYATDFKYNRYTFQA
jgi:fibro-slime domain-containing protein